MRPNSQPHSSTGAKTVNAVLGRKIVAFRMTSELRRQLIADSKNKLTESSSVIDFAHAAPVSAFKFKSPSNVLPDLEDDISQGKSIGDVFGFFGVDQILSTIAERIRAGHFKLSRKLATKIGRGKQQSFTSGEAALRLFARECLAATDASTREWANNACQAIAAEMSITTAQFLAIPIEILEQQLVPITNDSEPDLPADKSHGAQGQTKKPGSHSESRHR